MAIGRILAGIVLLIVFRNCLKGKKQFSGFIVMLPALTDRRQDILRLQALQPETKKESSLEQR